MSARPLACLFLLAGCVDPGAAPIDVPDDVDFVAVLAFDDDGALVESTGLVPAGGPVFAAPDATTHIVGYTSDALAGAAIVPDGGPLRTAEDCDPTLPSPSWYVDWSDDDVAPLDPATAPALALASARPDCRATCTRFETRTVSIEGTRALGLVNLGVRIDADTVLIGSYDPANAFLVDDDGTVTSTTIPVGEPIAGGFNGPDGAPWIVTISGAVWTGAWGALERHSPAEFPPNPSRGRAVFDQRRDPTNLFAVTNDYLFVRYDGATWERLAGYDGNLDLDIYVASDGPDEVFVIGAAESMLRWTPAGIEPTPLGAGGANAAAIVANVPGFGIVAGTNFGRLYFWEDGWVEAPEPPPLMGFPRVIVPLGTSFLVGGTAGVLTEYRFDGGYCEPEPVSPHRVQLFTDDEHGLVFYGGGVDMTYGVTYVQIARD